jgi:uncharacterized protein involved in exopolysaccharide biosynthesis
MNASADDFRDPDVLNMRQLLVRLWAGRWWIGGSTLLFGAIFVAAAFLMTPIFRASTVLIPVSSERNSLGNTLGSALGSLGGLASLAGLGVGAGDSATEEALAVLRSRSFTESFIADNSLLPRLYAEKWDAASNRWMVTGKDQPTLGRAVKYFDGEIRSILQDKKTGLVTLNIDWSDREEAARWANDIVQRLNSEMRSRGIAQAAASIGFLEKELDSTTEIGTRDAINRLIGTQIRQRMLANVSQEYVFRVVDKAIAPDSDNPLRPRKFLMFVTGPLVGLAIGIMAALVAATFRTDEGGRR